MQQQELQELVAIGKGKIADLKQQIARLEVAFADAADIARLVVAFNDPSERPEPRESKS